MLLSEIHERRVPCSLVVKASVYYRLPKDERPPRPPRGKPMRDAVPRLPARDSTELLAICSTCRFFVHDVCELIRLAILEAQQRERGRCCGGLARMAAPAMFEAVLRGRRRHPKPTLCPWTAQNPAHDESSVPGARSGRSTSD